MESKISHWIDRVTGGASLRSISRHLSISQPAFSRQLQEGRVSAEVVRDIARAYDASPLEGLEVLEFLTREELREYRAAPEWRKVSDRELLDEIERRLTSGVASNELASGDTPPSPPLQLTPREPVEWAADSSPNLGAAIRDRLDAEAEAPDFIPDDDHIA